MFGKNSSVAGGNERGRGRVTEREAEEKKTKEKKKKTTKTRERERGAGRKKGTAERSFEVAAGSFTFRNEIGVPLAHRSVPPLLPRPRFIP